MTDEIHFQWHNEFLLRTIYPMREAKLTDFLTFYQEMDIWARYKALPDAELEIESRLFRETQARLGAAVYDSYETLKAYFLRTDLQAELDAQFPLLPPDWPALVSQLHRVCATYLPRYGEFRKEGWFIAARISEWEANHKALMHQIAENQRTLRNRGPAWARREEYEQETARLLDAGVRLVDGELARLNELHAAISNLEKRQARLQTWKSKQTQNRATLANRLNANRSAARPLQEKKRLLQEELEQLRNPPSLESLEAYFTKTDVGAEYRAIFPAAETSVIAVFNHVHRTLAQTFAQTQATPARLRQLQVQFNLLADYLTKNETRLKLLSAVIVPMYRVELEQMERLIAALSHSSLDPAQIAALIGQKEQAIAALDTRLAALDTEASQLTSALQALDQAVGIPVKELLQRFAEFQPVTREDIARAKAEEFRQACHALDHTQLLEAVVARFLANPAAYPLWLMYMVVHFSGMRYKSAHGSWASARNLLLNLNLKDIEKEMRRLRDDEVALRCQEMLAAYGITPPPPAPEETPPAPPSSGLATSNDPRWRAKVEAAIKWMQSPIPYLRRKGLLQLRIEECSFEIDQIDDTQAGEQLEARRHTLPEWMWKEIVQLTALKLEAVDDKDWETITPDDVAARYSLASSTYRQIMDAWRQEFLTGWREEHDRTNQLIVTRAVCNEIAEHIQHLRGHSPAGGLAAKPRWYQRHENHVRWQAPPNPACFKKPLVASDFNEGASVLWLRFVADYPDQWRIAFPLSLKNGDGLLPENIFREGDGVWRYKQDPEGKYFMRSGEQRDENGDKVRVEQYMRWMHEATVALLGETADGPTVLLFETALPYEDKRQASMGVSRYRVQDLTYNIGRFAFVGTFVGYTPAGKIPLEDLKEMLDWNKILRRPALTEAEMARFWQLAAPAQAEGAACPICEPKPKAPGGGN